MRAAIKSWNGYLAGAVMKRISIGLVPGESFPEFQSVGTDG